METSTTAKDHKELKHDDGSVENKNDSTTDAIKPTNDPPTDPVKPTNDPPTDPVEPTNDPPTGSVKPANDRPTDPLKPTNDPPTDPVKSTKSPSTDPAKPANDPPTEPVKPTNTSLNDPSAHHVGPVNNPPRPDVEESCKKRDSGWFSSWSKKPKKLDFKNMPLDEKRSYYRCGDDYVTLDKVLPWPDYVKEEHYSLCKKGLLKKEAEFTTENDHINKKVSLWIGDITWLEIDAIVNAANRSLLGGGGVDGCIHRAAGKGLLEECKKLNGCETGCAKITSGQKLPAKHVIHTVGPIGERPKKLENCYKSCLSLMKEHELSSVAFCCISTGIYGYPNKKAAHMALKTVRSWLDENKDWAGRIIFCVFLEEDYLIYRKLMLEYFPCTVDKSIKEGDRSKDNSRPEPDDSRLKRKDEKPDTTKAHETSRSKGRGRRTENTSNEMPPKPGESIVKNEKSNTGKPKKESRSEGGKKESKKTNIEPPSTLLSLSQASSPKIETKDPKGENSRHVEGVKKDDSFVEKMDTSANVTEGAVERERKGTVENTANSKGDDEEKMDTTPSDGGNTVKRAAEGTKESAAEGSGDHAGEGTAENTGNKKGDGEEKMDTTPSEGGNTTKATEEAGGSAAVATGESAADRTGESGVDGTGESAAEGSRESVVEGTGQSGVDGTGETAVEGTGESAADATGESAVERTGESAADGSGESAVEGTGKSAVDETGESAVEGTGKSAVDETGESAVEGTGKSAVDETGESAVEGTGESAAERTGESAAEGTGESGAKVTGETGADRNDDSEKMDTSEEAAGDIESKMDDGKTGTTPDPKGNTETTTDVPHPAAEVTSVTGDDGDGGGGSD